MPPGACHLRSSNNAIYAKKILSVLSLSNRFYKISESTDSNQISKDLISFEHLLFLGISENLVLVCILNKNPRVEWHVEFKFRFFFNWFGLFNSQACQIAKSWQFTKPNRVCQMPSVTSWALKLKSKEAKIARTKKKPWNFWLETKNSLGQLR